MLGRQRRFDHGMAATGDVEGEAVIHLRTRVTLRHRQFAQAGRDIDHRQRIRRRRDGFGMGQGEITHLVK